MSKIMNFFGLPILYIGLSVANQDLESQLDSSKIEELTGMKGELDQKSGVFKISVPRRDLKVHAQGVTITPPLGLTSWAAFKQVGSETVVMGDLVLLESQVNSVMKKALEHNLKVTALHNHFLEENPKIMFMHIEGMGKIADVSVAIKEVFNEIKTSSSSKKEISLSEIIPDQSNFDVKKIEAILGKKGTLKEGVYKIVWGRTTKMDGHEMGETMGVNTWAAFAGTDQEAVMLGDIAMAEDEVQNVIKTLLKRNIKVVALHQHMLGENPRIIFLHYWGRGNTQELANGLQEALNNLHPTQ